MRDALAEEGIDDCSPIADTEDSRQALEMFFRNATESRVGGFVEAKPDEIVGFEHAKMILLPSSVSRDVRQAVEKTGIPVRTYIAANVSSRLDALNDFLDEYDGSEQSEGDQVRFSFTEVAHDEDTIRRNMEEVSKMDPVARIKGDRFKMGTDTLKQDVLEYFIEKTGGVVQNDDEYYINLIKKGVKDSFGHGMTPLKAALYEAVPEVLAHGRVVAYDENHNGKGYDGMVLAAPVEITEGEMKGLYYAGAVVNMYTDRTNKYYTHDGVFAILKKEGDDLIEPSGDSLNREANPGAGADESTGNRLRIEDILQKIKKRNGVSGQNQKNSLSESDKVRFSLEEYTEEKKNNTMLHIHNREKRSATANAVHHRKKKRALSQRWDRRIRSL